MDMMAGGDGGDGDFEDGVERDLTEALRGRPLEPQRVERVRTAVEAEWVRVTGRARQEVRARRAWSEPLWGAVAAAAAVAGIGITLLVHVDSRAPAAAFGSVLRLDGGAGLVTSGWSGRRRLKGGDALRSGDRISTDAPVLVELRTGGTLRIAANSELSVTGASQLALARGLIYLDIPPGSSRDTLRISTPAGTVEHLGTEFEVLSRDSDLRVRVREGRIRFLGRKDTLTADAGTELLVSGDAPVALRSIDTYGRDWSWTAALAPDYEIEGRPLVGFLNFVSRELGRTLEFADAKARQIADQTVLHGSVANQAPLDAMANVLATTSLNFELRGDKIWVRSSAAP
jgi:ferric-dicitrate binding protein FerR (iron transport regulator)